MSAKASNNCELHRMHEMHTIAGDNPNICLSVSHAGEMRKIG